MPIMGKNLIIYAGFGEGHKIASLALRDYFNAGCCDLLNFCPAPVRKIYSYGYASITDKYFFIWNILFYSARIGLIKLLIGKFHKIVFRPLYRYLNENNFTAIIVTHFFPLQLVAEVKERFNLKIITIITDFKVHPLWVNPKADFYFAALKETKQNLMDLGVSREKIYSGMVPLREGFLKDIAADDLRKKFSFDQKMCLLFVSSIRGNFPFFKEVFPELIDKFNIVVIYGRNNALKKYLSRFNSGSVKMFPCYEQMWELIGLSSIIISKPGGLTSFEGVYKKKFFVFTHYIPGQEKENMDLLIKYGVAKYAANKDDFLKAVSYFQQNIDELSLNYPLELKDIRPVLAKVV